MKKFLKATLCLLLIASMLCACGNDSKTKTYECKNLSMTVPKDFMDVTKQASMGVYDFVVGGEYYFALGLRTESYGTTAKEFAQYMAEEYNTTVRKQGDYYYFRYEASGSGMDFTYDSAVFSDGDYLWVVQAYCETKNYSKYKSDMIKLLDSVKIN